jgi:ArsR family transcriptional regulator
MIEGERHKKLLHTFKALSEESRLRILMLLKHGELCVCDIAENLRLTQPNISFHLSMLKDAGLIGDRKEGRWTYYSLNESDLFIRFLLLGIFERMNGSAVKKVVRCRKC